MKESLFIKQNKQKWKELEKHLQSDQKDPDKLSDLFIQVSDDLSYARTFYPNRSVRLYLNNLVQNVHSSIYKSRRSRWSDIVFFWKEELPKVVWDSRKELLMSLVVFILAVGIGVFSAIQDNSFAQLILGSDYVQMTLENIEKGDPMAVYKKSDAMDMFAYISLNNIKVDFITFASGLFLGIGSVVVMLFNGIMVGVFQYFFVEKGLFVESALTIWLHGTLEMAGMVLSCAAGIKLGSGLVFPGTYSRIQSFQKSAMNAFKLLLGTLPITLFAAVIESFLTRYTETPDWVRLLLIIFSLLFLVIYFVIYPVRKHAGGFSPLIRQTKILPYTFQKPDTQNIQSETELIRTSFSMFHHYFLSHVWLRILLLLFSCFMLSLTLYEFLPEYIDYSDWFFFSYFFDTELPGYIPLLHIVNMSVILMIVAWHIQTQSDSQQPVVRFWLKHFYKAVITSTLLYPVFLIHTNFFLFTLILIFATLSFIGSVLLIIFSVSVLEDRNLFSAIGKAFAYLSGQYMSVVGICAAMCTFMSLYYLFVESPFTYFFIQFILLNVQMEPETLRWFYIIFYTVLHYTGLCLLLPLALYGTVWKLYSLKEIKSAHNLNEKINTTWM